MKIAALTAALALVAAAPLAAQRPAPRDTSRRATMGHPMMPAQGMHQGMGGMAAGQGGPTRCAMMMGGMMHDSAMGGMMEGMMGSMAESAEHVLAEKATLRLTTDQERRITTIRDAARTDHDAAMRDAQRHGQELAEVMRAAAPDTSTMKAHFNGMQAGMGQAHLAMLRSAALTRAVLTDAQRRQVDSLATAMGCGMMGGGAAQPGRGH